jgi:putative ABC transport system permease protein
LVGVIVSVFLMAQQMSILLGILGRVAAFADGTSADLWVTSVATENTDITDSLPTTRVSAAASTAGVAWAAPVVQGMSRLTRPDGVRELVKILGVERPRYAGLARTLAPGTTPDALHGPARIFINWNDRPSYGFPEPGERVELGGRTAFIAGFFDGLDPHGSYSYVFADIDDARGWLDFPTERATFVAVGVSPGSNVEAVRERLIARLPDTRVVTAAELSSMETGFFLRRTPVGLVFGMGTAVAAFIGAFIVAITLYSSVIDRIRDYGTLKAIGATQRDLLRLLLAQAWIFFGVGSAIGLLAFFVVKIHATQAPMQAPPWMIAVVLVTAFVSCTGASVLAIRRVLSIDPAIVFRG